MKFLFSIVCALILSTAIQAQFGPPEYIVQNSGELKFVEPIDLDNDDDVDILIKTNAHILSYANDGSGLFSIADTITNVVDTLGHIAVGDLNSDDLPDIVTYEDSALTIYFNLGNGNWAVPELLDAGINAEQILIADMHGDTLQEIVLSRNFGYDVVWYNNDGGTFLTKDSLEISLDNDVNDIFVALLNADTIPDLFCYTSGNGKGIVAYGIDPDNDIWEIDTLNGNFSPFENAAIDVNNDGYLDLVNARSASWKENNGHNTNPDFIEHTILNTQWSNSVKFGEMGCGGEIECIWSSSITIPFIWSSYNSSYGAFQPKQAIPVTNTWADRIFLEDLNGDLRNDPIIVTADTIYWLLNDLGDLPVPVIAPVLDSLCFLGPQNAYYPLPLDGTPAGGHWDVFSTDGITNISVYQDTADVGSIGYRDSLLYFVIDGNGCMGSDMVELVNMGLPSINSSTSNFGPINYCLSDGPIQFTSIPTGGIWGGAVDSTGFFDPWQMGPDDYTTTYEYTDPTGHTCSNYQLFSILDNSTSYIDQVDTILCENAAVLLLNVTGGNQGTGISGPSTNIISQDPPFSLIASFDPAIGPGIYQIISSGFSGPAPTCPGHDTLLIEVLAAPIIDFDLDTAFCLIVTDHLLTGATPLGGEYSGVGVNLNGDIDVSIAGVGQHWVYYTFTDSSGCTGTDSTLIEVMGDPLVEFDLVPPTLCLNDTGQVLSGGTPLGGEYSGSGVQSDGSIDPTISGSGLHWVSYTYMNIAGCSSVDSTQLVILGAPLVLFEMDSARFCLNMQSQSLAGGIPLGGDYSGVGVNANGDIDPTVSGIGFYMVSYTYTDGFGCSETDSTVIEISICDGIDEIMDPTPVIWDAINNDLIVRDRTWIGATWQITDIRGRLLEQGVIDGSLNDNIRSQGRGLYQLTMVKGEEQMVIRILIQ